MAETNLPASMNQLDGVLNTYFGQKAPALPANIKEILVQFAPWFAILGIVLSVPGIVSLLGAQAMLSSVPMMAAYAPQAGYTVLVSGVTLIINVVLMVLALKGLFAKTKPGWTFMFYATLVNAVSSLLLMNIAGLVIGTALSFYILYQVKSYYK
jgi:hypothetical protein